tara:strand:+ start:27609 stop:31043 length:3435 start_codon:yes stop_codon:yes gene_type:complete
MPFPENDLYLASGVDQLINAYVDPVYKYDSSSFYNWEQDNLPLYDLEERDDLLFEMAGYPTSSMSGMMLAVSCCGIDNKKIFGNIQDLVKALPNTIRFPIVVEVAASGQLGEMRLENIQFEGPTAGLEIINRGFAKVLSGSGAPFSNIDTASVSAITVFESSDLSSTMTDSSAIGVSSTVWSTFTNANEYWDHFARAFVLPPEWAENVLDSEKTVDISTRFKDPGGTAFLTSTADKFSVETYIDNSVNSDIQIVLPDTTATQRSTIATGVNARVVGMTYANTLSNLVINNCTGKIFLRGFCVDGASKAIITTDGTQRTEIGMAIKNSSVTLENCAVTRCSEAGAEIVNSNVVLNRGFIAYRNYKLEETTLHLDTKSTFKTPGLKAVNSDIMLSSTVSESKGIPLDSPFCFSRNQVGVELHNSRVHNPKEFVAGADVDGGTGVTTTWGLHTLTLQSFLNIEEGIKAVDSIVDFDQRISVFQNKTGISLHNSDMKIGEFTADFNQEIGVLAKNSTITYSKNGLRSSYTGGPFYPQTSFDNNGQHINLINSTFDPLYVESGMLFESTRFGLKNNFKQVERSTKGTTEGKDTVPAVSLSKGSSMEAVCVKAQCYDVTGDSGVTKADTFRKGALFSVTEGSNLTLHGHKLDHTMLLGPYTPDTQMNTAALYAGKNSSIYVAGPTHIAQFGIDALAEDNSVIEFGPHKRDGTLDVSGWQLDNASNHTRVALHATRACLVANKNSEIIMKDLGDFQNNWISKYQDDLDLSPSSSGSTGFPNSRKTSPYTSSGAVYFYPNPFAAYGIGSNLLNLTAQAHPALYLAIATESTRTVPFTGTVTDLSYGGYCVRAVQDSAVTVQNVDFVCEFQNTSGVYYDASATACELLRMWNIADSSKLHASYISINQNHPRELSGTYYGPSALWNDGNTPLYGAPSSTPDTSSLSVLDTFGKGAPAGGEHGYYGESTHRNVGPFRIYVSPSPKASYLGFPESPTGGRYISPQYPNAFESMGFEFTDKATLKTGVPQQLFAQGYNPSGDCSASPVWSASAVYQDLGFSSYVESLPIINQEQNVASSFYYTADMLGDTAKNIWLDESAMNTFANAKNGTLSTSGRKAIFSFFSHKTVHPGEAAWNHDEGVGFGSASLFDTDRNI